MTMTANRRWLSMCGVLAILAALTMSVLKIDLSPTLGALLAFGIVLIALPYLPPLKLGFGKDGLTLETLQRDIVGLKTDLAGGKASLAALERRTANSLELPPPADPAALVEAPFTDDPNKGQFGGHALVEGRQLSATISRIEGTDLARVDLRFSPGSASPLPHAVTFHLHPTFAPNDKVTVPVDAAGNARLEITSYGAFTVGAVPDDGHPPLELDLVDAPGNFAPWRLR
jgi:hypothetical protein